MESTDEKEERKISSTVFVRLMCKNYLEESFLATHQYKAKLNDTKSQFINFSSSKRNWCGNQYVFRARNSNLFSVQLNSSFQKIFLSIFFSISAKKQVLHLMSSIRSFYIKLASLLHVYNLWFQNLQSRQASKFTMVWNDHTHTWKWYWKVLSLTNFPKSEQTSICFWWRVLLEIIEIIYF